MRRTTDRQRNGFIWNFTSMLEDLDFVDDIVSSKYEHIQNETNRLVNNVGRVVLKLNAQKCKAMKMNMQRENKVMNGREEVENVREFVCISGRDCDKEGGGREDIKKPLRKAQELLLARIQKSNWLKPWYD